MESESLSGFVASNSISAFLGAFFAYLFVRFGETLKAIADRKTAAYNATVQLERSLISLIDDISNNVFSLDQVVALQSELSRPGAGPDPITYNDLTPIVFDLLPLSTLANLHLINEVAVLSSDIKKINLSIANLSDFHTTIRAAFIDKSMDRANYIVNFETYIQRLPLLKKFMLAAEAKAKRLVVVSREMLPNKPCFTRMVLAMSHTDFPSEEAIAKGISELETEIRESIRANAKEIDRITGTTSG